MKEHSHGKHQILTFLAAVSISVAISILLLATSDENITWEPVDWKYSYHCECPMYPAPYKEAISDINLDNVSCGEGKECRAVGSGWIISNHYDGKIYWRCDEITTPIKWVATRYDDPN